MYFLPLFGDPYSTSRPPSSTCTLIYGRSVPGGASLLISFSTRTAHFTKKIWKKQRHTWPHGFSNLLSQSEHYYVNKFKRSGASHLLSFQGHHSSVENGSLKQNKTSPLNHDGWRNSICKFPSQSFWEPLVVSHRSPRPSTAPAGRFGRP